jgi:hypothetical protein
LSKPNFVSLWWWPLLAAIAGSLGMLAIWVTLATLSGRPLAWLGLLVALDITLLLKLAQAPENRWRTALAVLATAVTVAASYWLIVATQIGLLLGLDTLPSAMKLGPVLFWELLRRWLLPADWAWLAAALVLAMGMTRPARRLPPH